MLAITAGFAALATSAATFENLEALEARITAETALTPVAADRRIRLKHCPQPVLLSPESGGVVASCPQIGWRLRFAIAGGAGPTMPAMISRNQAVEVRYAGPGFAVMSQGMALDAAHKGQALRVKISTGAVVGAVAEGIGRVVVDR